MDQRLPVRHPVGEWNKVWDLSNWKNFRGNNF